MGAIDTILNALKAAIPDLAVSQGSIERKIVDVVGSYADSEAVERANTIEIINNALASQRITTRDYYRRIAVAFQPGDVLSYDSVNQGAYYENVDTEKQIVKQAYIVGEFPSYTLLVNALDSSNNLRALTSDELAGFRTYFSAYQPIGMQLGIASLDVAKISDPNMVVYVRPGVDSEAAATAVNEALKAAQATLRSRNTVTLSEIEDIIQTYDGISGVGWSNPIATEQKLDGSTVNISPVKGLFELTNGAFTFTTTLTVDNFKTLQ